MKKVMKLYQDSLKELTVTRNLVFCGLMAALAVVLGMVTSINIGPYIRIGFSGLPNRLVEFLFGPAVGCFFGGALDILKYIVRPDGPFFFGFTVSAMISGLIYGSIFYRKPVSLKRILIAEFLVKLIVDCFLNTLWLSMLYGKGFFVLLPARLVKNFVMFLVDSAIQYFLLNYVGQAALRFGFVKNKITA